MPGQEQPRRGAAQSQAQPPTQPSEEELRAAYEAELNRITSADMLLQTAASLLNLGARRLGLTGAGRPSAISSRCATRSTAYAR